MLLSALPRMPGFAWLHEHVAALGVIRCYSRAGQMALVGMAVLAGYGAARIMGALRAGGPGARASHAGGSAPDGAEGGQISRGGWALALRHPLALAIALVAAINLEALRAPLAYREFAGIPAIYDVLRDEPQAVVIELPFFARRVFFLNAPYMINATRHRHPLVNGYSGFAPPDLERTVKAMRAFPRGAALKRLHRLGVTHIVVHRDSAQMQRRRARIDASPALRLVVERDGNSNLSAQEPVSTQAQTSVVSA